MNKDLETLFTDSNLSAQRKMISDICKSSPMFNCVLHKVKNRHLIDGNGHWLADFATQDYLGFDFEPRVIDAAIEATKQYGTVVAWCRLVATVDLFDRAEQEIAKLIGTEAVSIFASTTLLNHGVIPALLGKDGALFLDKSGHATMYEAGKIARDSGSKLISFPTEDYEALEQLLIENNHISKKLIAVDGVNSMTGDYTNLPVLDKLAKKYDALVYVDDAHGFGVVGENPDINNPYGSKGNGLIKHFGLTYENMLYIGCFSKAYGSFGSFIGCSHKLRDFLISQATPHDLGGAGPASAMAAVLEGVKINAEKGDAIRQRIHILTQRALNGLQDLGFDTYNTTSFPIISVPLYDGDLMIEASHILYQNHILLTLAPYPMVKRGNEAFRITVTSTNTEEEIDQLILAFSKIKEFLIEKNVPLSIVR
jgi:8-amino-7-oxononanoate synthase